MTRVYIKTYGCQMNVRDSEDVAAKLEARGYTLVSNEENADVVLLNTCSVREQAELKAIGKAGNILSNRKGDKKFVLGIMGCMAQNRGEELFESLPDLNLVVGTQKFHRVPELLDKVSDETSSGSRAIVSLDDEIDSQNKIQNHKADISGKCSAFVSIMQGCNMNCSFCIVPKTRGRERYRPIKEIVEEVSRLADKGIKEVTLLGQIVNAYGRGSIKRVNNKSAFVQLLESIHAIDGIKRIRFTSPHPTSFGNDLIEAFQRLEKLGLYAHLPMQSGSNKILKSMNRPYTREKFISLVKTLRSAKKGIRLSTDIIVGYPGESENDFNLTLDAFSECGFEMGFIFKYSERSGTPASNLEDKVPQEIKELRNQTLLSLLENQSLASNQKLIGKKMSVLVEGRARRGQGMLMGRTDCYRRVVFSGNERLINTFASIKIDSASVHTLFGSTC